MEGFLYTVAMASISGLTFIAYKHPKAFYKMFSYILSVSFLAYSMIMTWNIAGSYLRAKLSEQLTEEQFAIIEPTFEAVRFPSLVISAIYGSLLVYLIFLNSLPSLLHHDDESV